MRKTVLIYLLAALNVATLSWCLFAPSTKSLNYGQVVDLVRTRDDALSVFNSPIRTHRNGQLECLTFRERPGALLILCFDQSSKVVEYRFTGDH
jgi:hypothetical protein